MTPHLTTIHDPQTARELAATHPAQAALAGRRRPQRGDVWHLLSLLPQGQRQAWAACALWPC